MSNIFKHRFFFLIFSVLFVLALSSNVRSADLPVLEKTISIVIKQERIDVALKRISQQAGFTFSYNPAIVDVSKIVSFNFPDKTIREILDELFDGNIDYKERRQYIILTKARKIPTSKESKVLTGYVTDDATGKKIANATIYDPISLSSSVSDAYGFFKIKIRKPTSDLILTVNTQNYSDTIVVVPNRRRLIKISIKNKKEKIVSLADSAWIKSKRFFGKRIFLRRDVNRTNVHDTIYRKAQISIVPFVGTNHLLSGNVINDYSFNIYGGYSLGVRKLEIAGLFNIVRGDVLGTQLAGSVNGVYGKVKGVQMAGYVNANRDSMNGAQLAGLVNLNWNSVKRFSAAGLLNLTRHESDGVILAGLGNITLGRQKRLHIAGLLNFSSQDAATKQLAGFCNFTSGTHTGAQLAGFLNYATALKGLQFGVINVCDSVIKGVPIGLFSFVAKGYHKVEISADEIFYANLSFRTGTRQFYNIFTAGIKPQNDDNVFWTVGYGVGTAPRINKWLSLNVDLTANQISKGNFTEAINMVNKLYLGVELKIIDKVGLALGITMNNYLTDTTYKNYPAIFTDYNPTIINDYTYSNNLNQKFWLGGRVGIRFL